MTGSFMARHRTICAVLDEINELAVKRGDFATERLCVEAKDYAQRMSARLVERSKQPKLVDCMRCGQLRTEY